MELVDLRVRLFARFYQERLRLFETLVNNSPDGIGVSSMDGRQIHPNPAFRVDPIRREAARFRATGTWFVPLVPAL